MVKPPDNGKKYTVTAALIYANGGIHIGHLAGCYLPADIYVRYLRANKQEVVFISGTDEHGAAITLRAKQEGITPQEMVDKYHRHIKASFDKMRIAFDIFYRTSHALHHQRAQEFFLRLHEKDCFVKKEVQQYYNPLSREFLADRYVQGRCSFCGHREAYADQCEACGRTLGPDDLLDPRAFSGEQLVKKKATHWYLPLNKWEHVIAQYLATRRWKKHVVGQCQSWLQEGLQPRAMTRDLPWGVKVPLPEAANKVLYVWFDAPIGYISATEALKKEHWKAHWQGSEAEIVHFVGKDNIVFHCIVFPMMLHLHGDYAMPAQVPANEFLTLEGRKISTSRGWAVWVSDYLQALPEHADTLRYVLCANMPENKDADFSWRRLQAVHNDEIIGIFGNFVHRTCVLTNNLFAGKVPSTTGANPHKEVLSDVAKHVEAIGDHLGCFQFKKALLHVMNIARAGNKLLADTQPWRATASEPEPAAHAIYTALQLVATLGVVSAPFLPETAEKIGDLLNWHSTDWTHAKRSEKIAAGHRIATAKPLVQKIEDSVIAAQIDLLERCRHKSP